METNEKKDERMTILDWQNPDHIKLIGDYKQQVLDETVNIYDGKNEEGSTTVTNVSAFSPLWSLFLKYRKGNTAIEKREDGKLALFHRPDSSQKWTAHKDFKSIDADSKKNIEETIAHGEFPDADLRTLHNYCRDWNLAEIDSFKSLANAVETAYEKKFPYFEIDHSDESYKALLGFIRKNHPDPRFKSRVTEKNIKTLLAGAEHGFENTYGIARKKFVFDTDVQGEPELYEKRIYRDSESRLEKISAEDFANNVRWSFEQADESFRFDNPSEIADLHALFPESEKISEAYSKAFPEPTLFDFEEEEKKQQAMEKDKHSQIEISFAEKADWKNENGEEIYIFIEKEKFSKGYKGIEIGLAKNYDEKNSIYNNSDNSFHGIAVLQDDGTVRNKDSLPLLHAVAHPNDESIKLLSDSERREFDVVMRNINPEYKKAYEDKLEQEKRDREANAGKNAANYVLERLKTAGIEVVTDKDAFNRILEREQNLQKMTGTLTPEEQKRYFTFNDEETKHFKEQVDEWKKNKDENKRFNPGKLIEVGKIPPLFKALGISDNPIEVQYSTLSKMTRPLPEGYPNDAQGHELTIDDIYSIPEQLADPVMVFKSRTRDDSYVFFTERKDKDNHSILIPLAVNKNKGRIVINEITSMYGKNNEVNYVRTNLDDGNLIYADKKRSLEWERECKVQFLTQGLPNQDSIDNILTKERLVNFISADSQEKIALQKMSLSSDRDNIYGFAYDGKIYLNSDFLNSNVAVHEYTHLWDEYTRRTNPELWQKGMNLLKGTKLFAEVKNDPDYADIANDDNLVLSEVHARICGKLAQEYLEQIAREDGEITSISASDWNERVAEYIGKELFPENKIFYQRYHTDGIKENEIDGDAVARFLSTPMTDLAKGLSVKHRDFETRFKNGDLDELFDRLSDINFKTTIYKTMSKEEQARQYDAIWKELFPDGEPEEIQSKRENWRKDIEEYEKEKISPENIENWKHQAKDATTETLAKFLSIYKDDNEGRYAHSQEEADKRNERRFKDDILNTMGKHYSSWHDGHLNWNDIFVHSTDHLPPDSFAEMNLRISLIESELKERGILKSEEKNMKNTASNELTEEEKKVLLKPLASRTKTWFTNQNKTIKDMLDIIVQYNGHDFDIKKSDSGEIYIQGYDNRMKPRGRMTIGETELNYLGERLTNELWLKDIKKFSEDIEIEKLSAEVNPNGGNDRGFQFGVKDLEHLKGIKRLLDDFEKNPPKHSELEDLEASKRRYAKESKRLQKIYEKENDTDALKGAQKNADYANFYHWQAEKLNKDIIQHPDKFDSVKNWYEKAYPDDKETVGKMSEYLVFGQLELDLENGVGYGQPNSSSERYGEYDSIVRERLFQKLAEMDNVGYDVIYDKWLHADEKHIQQPLENKPEQTKPVPAQEETISAEVRKEGKKFLNELYKEIVQNPIVFPFLIDGEIDTTSKDKNFELAMAKTLAKITKNSENPQQTKENIGKYLSLEIKEKTKIKECLEKTLLQMKDKKIERKQKRSMTIER